MWFEMLLKSVHARCTTNVSRSADISCLLFHKKHVLLLFGFSCVTIRSLEVINNVYKCTRMHYFYVHKSPDSSSLDKAQPFPRTSPSAFGHSTGLPHFRMHLWAGSQVILTTNLAAGRHDFLPGPQLPSQPQGITALKPVKNYTAQ